MEKDTSLGGKGLVVLDMTLPNVYKRNLHAKTQSWVQNNCMLYIRNAAVHQCSQCTRGVGGNLEDGDLCSPELQLPQETGQTQYVDLYQTRQAHNPAETWAAVAWYQTVDCSRSATLMTHKGAEGCLLHDYCWEIACSAAY